MSCDYQGHEFGASYPDSICIDGYLWNADSGDPDPSGDGWIYTSGGEFPCPNCRFKEAVARIAEEDIEARAVRHYDAGRTGYLKRPVNRKWFWNNARRMLRSYLIREGYSQ